MTSSEALKIAEKVLYLAKVSVQPTAAFLERLILTAEAAKSLTPKQREAIRGFSEWVYTWRKMFDEYDVLVKKDPGIQYVPRNKAAYDFHSSSAFIRYFRAGNRTSKTQSGYMEHYFALTGQNPFRKYPRPPAASFIVAGLPFTSYKDGVFEAKLITGEAGNPLSPLFPEGGKWFNHYDDRQHVLTLGCLECAETNKSGSCKHQKSKIKLFSIEQGSETIQGQAYLLGHFDEDVIEENFFHEGRQRVKTVPGGCLIITGTPLHGEEAWEQRYVAKVAEAGGPENRISPSNPRSQQLASIHEVDQFTANIVPHDQIQMEMRMMDEFQIQARIYGKPMPLAERPVFDRKILAEWMKKTIEPTRGELWSPDDKELSTLTDAAGFEFNYTSDGPLRVWQPPQEGQIYLLAVDTASGLYAGDQNRRGDASCASIFRVDKRGSGVTLDMVAQYHGWITPLDYADEVYKLALWYNQGLVVIETTGGLGLAVVMKIRQEYAYWNMYRDQRDFAGIDASQDQRFGVDTNATSKPFMVSSLQSLIRERRISVPCKSTIHELTAFEQEVAGKGGSRLLVPRYRGANGTPDDRTMSLAIAAGVAVSYEPLHYELIKTKPKREVSKEWKEVEAELKAQDIYD